MEISPAESRILKKVIRTWIESEYGNLAKLNYLKQNIDDSTWKLAKRLHSEIGKVVSLDFILETVIETILILYPEYDAEERKRQELEDAERKHKEALEAIEQSKQRELEAIRQREEKDARHRREDILRGDIDRIRVIVRDCVCEVLEEEPKEGIDDEHLLDELSVDEFSVDEFSVLDIYTAVEIRTTIETAIESVVETSFQFPDDLSGCSTINHISKAISFFFMHGRFPNKSKIHDRIVAMSRLACQMETDAKTLKTTLIMLKEKSWSEFSRTLSESPLANNPKSESMLIELFMRYAPPWSTSNSQRDKNIESLISATQALIDNPYYSDDYGYDGIKSVKK